VAGVADDTKREDSWVGWRHDVVDRVVELGSGTGSTLVENGGAAGGSGGMEVGKMGFVEMTLLMRRMSKR